MPDCVCLVVLTPLRGVGVAKPTQPEAATQTTASGNGGATQVQIAASARRALLRVSRPAHGGGRWPWQRRWVGGGRDPGAAGPGAEAPYTIVPRAGTRTTLAPPLLWSGPSVGGCRDAGCARPAATNPAEGVVFMSVGRTKADARARMYTPQPPPHQAHRRRTGASLPACATVLSVRVASRRAGCQVPTVSKIGQSASSIHVHVNIRNPRAWPRTVGSTTHVPRVVCLVAPQETTPAGHGSFGSRVYRHPPPIKYAPVTNRRGKHRARLRLCVWGGGGSYMCRYSSRRRTSR